MWENLFRCLVVSNFRLGAAINDIHLSDSVEVLKNRGSTSPCYQKMVQFEMCLKSKVLIEM